MPHVHVCVHTLYNIYTHIIYAYKYIYAIIYAKLRFPAKGMLSYTKECEQYHIGNGQH